MPGQTGRPANDGSAGLVSTDWGHGHDFCPEVKSGVHVRFLSQILLLLLTVYRRCISPFLPPACRFTPTCSEYAVHAVTLHGPFKGVLLTAWRLCRCHPLCRGGYDPVPEPSRPRPSRLSFMRTPGEPDPR